jgi:hypothetical protein
MGGLVRTEHVCTYDTYIIRMIHTYIRMIHTYIRMIHTYIHTYIPGYHVNLGLLVTCIVLKEILGMHILARARQGARELDSCHHEIVSMHGFWCLYIPHVHRMYISSM